MKTLRIALNILLNLIRVILIAGILLFSIATFMAKSYIQTLFLLMVLILLIYWPGFLKQKFGNAISLTIRILSMIILFSLNFTLFKTGPKTSIYLSEDLHKELIQIYDERLDSWPENTTETDVQTKYGNVHVLACGSEENPPLMMIHAASMGAHSWSENLEPLLNHYRIYSIDNIGEGNKSKLYDATTYPNSQKEIAEFYATIADSLKIDSCPVFGASNGGYISMVYAYYFPERVKSLALFGPMGLTQLTPKSIMMLSITTLYPFQFIRDIVTKWAIGDKEHTIAAYGKWFNCIINATMPSVAMPVPMTPEQKNAMDMPVLLFLGTEDNIVGDAENAKEIAADFPDIQIEILESGHLIAVDQYKKVNESLLEFLDIR